MSGSGVPGHPGLGLTATLNALERTLVWNPPDAGPSDANIVMFGPSGRNQRFVEMPPSFTPRVREDLEEREPREYLVRLLADARPIGYGIEHDAVSLLHTEPHRELTEFLDCYGTDRHLIARRMRQALGADLVGRAEQLRRGGIADSDHELRALRESFRLAELCWALGLESAGTSSSVPVVIAAVEACSIIGGALLELSPESDTMLDEDLLQRIHHARTAWIGILLRFDTHADLVADGGERLNERLVRLIGRADDPPRGRLRTFFHIFEEDPVPLVGPRLRRLTDDGGRADELDALRPSVRLIEQEEEHRFLDVAARLLLPRYMIDEAVGLLQYLGSNERRRRLPTGRELPRYSRTVLPLIPAAVAGVLLLIIAFLMTVRGLVERVLPGGLSAVESSVDGLLPGVPSALAGVLQGVWWLLVVLAIAWIVLSADALRRRGRSASYLLMLRVPSATAFGLAILLALSFAWIGTQSGMGRLGPLVALLAAFGYSAVEFINQGGNSRKAARPALVLTVLAGGMALMVATLVLEVFGRTLLTQVPNYAMLADPMVRLETLTILASISLALGTFLQSIWDEQTITAPLSHLRLRG